ncbi:hypothetical protein C1645_872842 [Glomus cerebriforme]|uniref:Uncharacterized protein n=1 Tax=Glomus cerebriforme TaxID=658196 RepID=A0A397TAQ2_9GLOM|nr:hypothetical protein C1645_872842 [Glomus cerebriforme]
MPGEKYLPMVKIMNEKADNCQVLQIFGDAKSLESALGLGLAKKLVELAEELPKISNFKFQVKKDENGVKEIKEFLSKDQKTVTNELIERDLESIRIDINNAIKDGDEKIGELIKEIDGFILKKKKWCECVRGYIHTSDYNCHRKNYDILKISTFPPLLSGFGETSWLSS